LRARIRRVDGVTALAWWRLRDYGWRLSLLVRDAALPAALVALLSVAAWALSGQSGIEGTLQAATVLAALAAIVGFGASALNALRRHLLVASPAGARPCCKRATR
jgi:hypothetical protein